MPNNRCQKDNKKQHDLRKIKDNLDILNDVNRLRILCLLRKNNEMCVCEIFAALDLPQNLVSYHLGKLKDAGFLEANKDGVKVIYRLGAERVKNFQSLINHLFN
jgi:DNA-binding transcriptional ArsR family regulator